MLGRRGRRRKRLLDDIKETWGCWKLKEDCIRSHYVENWIWKISGPVVRQTKELT